MIARRWLPVVSTGFWIDPALTRRWNVVLNLTTGQPLVAGGLVRKMSAANASGIPST
jgi:Flp pilus assembly secretin CpaC